MKSFLIFQGCFHHFLSLSYSLALTRYRMKNSSSNAKKYIAKCETS